MPPLIRRASLLERVKAYLNPWDFLLYLSEELNGSDWEDFQRKWATPTGLALNFVFMIARANSAHEVSRNDDVFGDQHGSGSGWTAWLASSIVHLLTCISSLNAFYTFWRKRHYRLFEANLDQQPSTPSARRVRVDASPVSSSPLRFLQTMMASPSAEDRSHPDPTRDVWEVAVWDPTPLCLRLFCLFSPGHVMIYWLFLPVVPLAPSPSLTVVTTTVLSALLSIQLSLLYRSFSQQAKDAALIHKEVLHEYDTKFVHPSLNRPVRDVGTQSITSSTASPGFRTREVDVYTPTTIVNRGFRTHPNPSYAPQYDPQGLTQQSITAQRISGLATTPAFNSPLQHDSSDYSSPLRPRGAAKMQIRPSSGYRDSSVGAMDGDGGSLGVYSNIRSPVRKAMSANTLRSAEDDGADAFKSRRLSSPSKKTGAVGSGALGDRIAQLKGRRRESGRM